MRNATRPRWGGATFAAAPTPRRVLTDTTGAVEIDVPRDRAATFEPQIVKKRQRRLSGVDEVVPSLMPSRVPPRVATNGWIGCGEPP